MKIQVIDKDNKTNFDLSKECGKFMNYMSNLGFESSAQSGISMILQKFKEVRVENITFRKVI